MRPLIMSVLSSFASITLAIVTYTFADSIDISQTISPATFTTLLICILCAFAALTSLWISLSYLLLAYAQRTPRQHSTLFIHAARLTTPRVRRTLLGAIVLSIAIAQPAYADEYTDTQNSALVDISWGSPDLVDIAQQPHDEEAEEKTPAPPTPTQTPGEAQPAPSPHNSPLTSPTTNTTTNTTNSSPLTSTPAATNKTQRKSETPTRSLSPPQEYTVKNGDTLWDIAARHLPKNASDSDIARSCLMWTRNNPHITNPNLIFPGQHLTIPQEIHP